MSRTSNGRGFAWAILIAFTTLVVWGALHHEPWRDEAQAWLLARDSGFFELFGRMGHEGHPALWHVLLWPLARLGLPYESMHVLHVAIAVGCVAILVHRSPFPRPFQAFFTFGYYLAFEYSVVARNYSLSVLLLLCIAACNSTRHKHPLRIAVLVALLANTNVHSLIVAMMLGLLTLFEALRTRPRRAVDGIAIGIMLAGGLVSLWQLWPPADVVVIGHVVTPTAPIDAVRNAFFPGTAYSSILFQGLAVVLLLTCLTAIRTNPRALLLVAGSLGGMFLVFVFKHGGQPRHHGLVLTVVVVALWIALESNAARESPANSSGGPLSRLLRAATLKHAVAALTVSQLLSIDLTVRMYEMEIPQRFSAARAMAEYIADRAPDTTIAAHQSAPASALLPYLPDQTFWYVDVQRYGTFSVWDRHYGENMEIGEFEMLTRINEHFGDEWPWILVNRPLTNPEAAGLELRHVEVDDVFGVEDERFLLYAPLF